MKAYKGFDKDMKCRGFQYEEGKTYEADSAVLCKSGFHACTMPLDTFAYYQPGKSVYYEVEVDDNAISDPKGDSKVSSKKITIGARLSIKDLVTAQISMTKAKSEGHAATSGYMSSAATSGDMSSAATSGYMSSAATSGDMSSAATSGYMSSAATSGDRSVAVSCGFASKASTMNKNAVALACGEGSMAAGSKGSWIVLTEFDNENLLCVKVFQVDDKLIKADTFYKLVNGEPVEAERKNG